MSNTIKLADGDYAQQILSYYLWGQETAPSASEVADGKWIRNVKNITVNIDATEYMQKVGYNVPLSQQLIFQNFFNNAKSGQANGTISLNDIKTVLGDAFDPNAKEIKLTHEQFATLTYGHDKNKYKTLTETIDDKGNPVEFKLSASQYIIGTDEPDYWQRAFTFGSTGLALDRDAIRYVYDAETGQALRIENVAVRPVDDNFDFESSDGGANSINSLLKQIMDPSGIGKTVNIHFTDNRYFQIGDGIFTQDDYANDVLVSGGNNNRPKVASMNYVAYQDGLEILDQSGIYNFRDENNRIVVFGSQENDALIEYQAKNLQLDKDVDVSAIDNKWQHLWLDSTIADAFIDNEYSQYLKNGIVYIAGNGNDTIVGTQYNDQLIGGNGIDSLDGGKGSDRLEGGQGFDIYHVDNGDTILDSDGVGCVLLNRSLLGNFQQDENNQSIWYDATGIIAQKHGNHLIIRDTDNHEITIENYFQVATHLADDSYSALNIRLLNQEITPPETSDYLLWTGDIRPNTQIIHNDDGSITDTGIYDVNWTDHSQRNEKGEIINGTKQDGFNDVIFGSFESNNKMYGLGGNDSLQGGKLDDILIGGDGDDLISGIAGNDLIFGGIGNDFIFSNLELNTKLRNSDDDKPGVYGKNMYILSSTWCVYHDDDNINSYEIDYGNYRFSRWNEGDMSYGDVIYAGTGDDHVAGSDANDVIYGDGIDDENGQLAKDGDDYIEASGGDDLIYGGGGNDIILGDGYDFLNQNTLLYTPLNQHGNDTIFGGDGNDQLIGGGGDDFILGEDGDDILQGDLNLADSYERFEQVAGDDFIDGGNGNDTIYGGGGKDYLLGGDGNDTVYGDYQINELSHIGADDYLDGGDGDDQLFGGLGDDILIAGKGRDVLNGGQGDDVYIFNREDLTENDTNIIIDKDGKGSIMIDGVLLENHAWKAISENIWQAENLTLQKTGNDLEISFQGALSRIVIQDFTSGDLGISLPAFNPEINEDDTGNLNDDTGNLNDDTHEDEENPSMGNGSGNLNDE